MPAAMMWPVLCMVAVGLVLASASPPRAANRYQRSDDGGPLEAVVEQLAQQLNSLSAQLTQRTDTLTDRVGSLETKTAALGTSVAFLAWNSVSPVHTTPRGTVVLDRTTTNVGHGYDTATGVFTAPVSGLYDFQVTFMANSGSDVKVYTGIYADGHLVVQGVADSGHGYWDQTSIRAVIHAAAGQQVMVKNMEDTSDQFYSYRYTTFSGFLIKADL